MRGISSIYNAAVAEDIFIPEKNPFHHYKIPTTRYVKKKALPKESILSLKNLDYKFESTIWHTKNYMVFMFNARGMNLIDLAKLRVKSIVGEYIFYGRSKTNDPLSVKITAEMKSILEHYTKDKAPDDFIFPIGNDGSAEQFKKYRSDRRLVNKQMKIIAKDDGIEERMTTYYLRHSWATIAKHMGISTEVISEGLGHGSVRTTKIYLKSFESKTLDEANEMIVG